MCLYTIAYRTVLLLWHSVLPTLNMSFLGRICKGEFCCTCPSAADNESVISSESCGT